MLKNTLFSITVSPRISMNAKAETTIAQKEKCFQSYKVSVPIRTVNLGVEGKWGQKKAKKKKKI